MRSCAWTGPLKTSLPPSMWACGSGFVCEKALATKAATKLQPDATEKAIAKLIKQLNHFRKKRRADIIPTPSIFAFQVSNRLTNA